MNKKLIISLAVLLIIAVGAIIVLRFRESSSTPTTSEITPTATNDQNPIDSPRAEPVPQEPAVDLLKYDTTSPDSIHFIANKTYSLPENYIPTDLVVPDVRLRLSSSHEQMKFRQISSNPLKQMFDAAKADGVELVFGSGYRSYSLQSQFYNSYVARDGKDAADRYSARPGHSEHQTGLSFDATSPSGACHLEICFEDTPEGAWLAKNAHKFGFTIRYQNGKESITGYQYEPWHFRYVGVDLANQLQETGETLEEFFNLTSKYAN